MKTEKRNVLSQKVKTSAIKPRIGQVKNIKIKLIRMKSKKTKGYQI